MQPTPRLSCWCRCGCSLPVSSSPVTVSRPSLPDPDNYQFPDDETAKQRTTDGPKSSDPNHVCTAPQPTPRLTYNNNRNNSPNDQMVYNSSENVYQTPDINYQLLSSAIPTKQNPAVFLLMRARWTASPSLRETYFRCSQACAFFSPATPSKTTTSHVHPPPAFSRSLVL